MGDRLCPQCGAPGLQDRPGGTACALYDWVDPEATLDKWLLGEVDDIEALFPDMDETVTRFLIEGLEDRLEDYGLAELPPECQQWLDEH